MAARIASKDRGRFAEFLTANRVQKHLQQHAKIHARETHTKDSSSKARLLTYAREALGVWGGALYRAAEASWPCPRAHDDPLPVTD